jgi:hypothetical protein
LDIKIGDVVLVERKYKFYEAKVINAAMVSDRDADCGAALFFVLPLKGLFRRGQWVKSCYIQGKLP